MRKLNASGNTKTGELGEVVDYNFGLEGTPIKVLYNNGEIIVHSMDI